MRTRGTKKPCSGCGEVDDRRKADAVCSECARLIAFAKEKIGESKKSPFPVVYVGERYHWFMNWCLGYMGKYEKAQEAFHDLALAVGRKVHYGEIGKREPEQLSITKDSSFYMHSGNSINLEMPEDTVKAFRKLEQEIFSWIRSAYLDGIEKGQGMLRQLVRGEISVDALNEEIIDEAERLRREYKEKREYR